MPNNIATIGDKIETYENGLLETEHAALHDEHQVVTEHELEDLEAIVEDSDEGARERFAPQLVVQPVADFDARMQAIDAERAEIRAKMNDGELEYDDAEAQLDALADQRSDLRAQQQEAIRAARTNELAARGVWEREVTGFLRSHPEFENDPVLWGALDATVKRLANETDQDGQYVNADRDARWFLDEAHRQVAALARHEHRVGRGDADERSGGRGSFRELDQLQGFELEEALQRQSQEDRDAYLRGGD